MTVDEKRNAAELTALLQGDQYPVERKTILSAFEQMLSEYVTELLDPQTDDATALHTRAKALGIVETMQRMGQDMRTIMQEVTAQRSVRERIHGSLNLQR